jgi:hypothetical protein
VISDRLVRSQLFDGREPPLPVRITNHRHGAVERDDGRRDRSEQRVVQSDDAEPIGACARFSTQLCSNLEKGRLRDARRVRPTLIEENRAIGSSRLGEGDLSVRPTYGVHLSSSVGNFEYRLGQLLFSKANATGCSNVNGDAHNRWPERSGVAVGVGHFGLLCPNVKADLGASARRESAAACVAAQ